MCFSTEGTKHKGVNNGDEKHGTGGGDSLCTTVDVEDEKQALELGMEIQERATGVAKENHTKEERPVETVAKRAARTGLRHGD
jgi:hypothetical protein